MRRASRFAGGAAGWFKRRGERFAATRAFTNGRFAAVPGTFGNKSKSATKASVRSAASTSSRRIGNGPDRSLQPVIAAHDARGEPRVRAGKPITLSQWLTVAENAVLRTIDYCAGRATSPSRSRGARRGPSAGSPCRRPRSTPHCERQLKATQRTNDLTNQRPNEPTNR